MDEKDKLINYLQSLVKLQLFHPVTGIVHMKLYHMLQSYNIKTLLDVGGIGKTSLLGGYQITEANIVDGLDGSNLPYGDNSFDAVVSIATLEHAKNQIDFLKECYRVAKVVSMHWFPLGDIASAVEKLKKEYGYQHPCHIPDVNDLIGTGLEYKVEVFMGCSEHLLLCMTLNPLLKNPEVYRFIIDHINKPYGAIFISEK